METIADLLKAIIGFSSIGTTGFIAAIIFTVLVSVGGFFLSRWARKYRIEEANRKTDESRSESSSETSSQGREIEKDSGKAADEIDKIGRH